MKKSTKVRAPLVKIKSLMNSETFYTSSDFPNKIIDGKEFLGVKRFPSDKTLRYVLKENMQIVSNE